MRIGELPLRFSLHGSSARERAEVRATDKRGRTWQLFYRMGEAFDAACKGLQDGGQPDLVREIIAKRIIKAAMQGERDPVRLRDAGLAALG